MEVEEVCERGCDQEKRQMHPCRFLFTISVNTGTESP